MKILKRIGITFLILIALLGMWIAVNSIDDRELSAEAKEMLKPFPEVPPEENGYEVISYIFADNFSVTSDRDNQKVNNIAKGKITDLDFSRKVIETKQKIINDAISASKKPSFKFPSPKEAYDLPRFQRFIQAARLILVKARIDLNDGNIDAALANLEGGVDFCKILYLDKNYYLISYVLGNTCLAEMTSALHEISATRELTPIQYTHALKIPSAIPDYPNDNFNKTFQSEVQFINRIFSVDFSTSTIEKLNKIYHDDENSWKSFSYLNAIFPKYFIHPTSTINLAASRYTFAATDSSNFCKYLESSKRFEESELKFEINENPLLPYWMRAQLPWFWNDYFMQRCLAHTYYDAVKAIITLHAYEHEHQALPAQLSELVPQYLDKLPIDYFDGQPLRYSVEHRWLYSVGTDFNDDHGAAQGFNKGSCRDAQDKNACNTNPTFPIDWKDYPAETH